MTLRLKQITRFSVALPRFPVASKAVNWHREWRSSFAVKDFQISFGFFDPRSTNALTGNSSGPASGVAGLFQFDRPYFDASLHLLHFDNTTGTSERPETRDR
ncbi:hypothetical protein Pla52n_09730 [Stieleria varia]|uniref:Uncharacterized protein n=1 Tax=Stieleria varia TaxID=2528005 RepID=A0A5C6BAB8_9BACT|nr:hypothetical protein Pla52n_09730 [Stieleria varia]